jgi:peptidylprolyl isomerase
LRAFSSSNAGVLFALAIAGATAGCAAGTSGTDSAQMTASAATAAPSLQITDTKLGTGVSPKPGHICIVHYTGWVYDNGAKGAKFDSSADRKQPFSFQLGQHKVIEGWEQGVTTMKIGGKRTLIIPPALAYGSAGHAPMVPPNATLIFEIELLDVKLGSFSTENPSNSSSNSSKPSRSRHPSASTTPSQ